MVRGSGDLIDSVPPAFTEPTAHDSLFYSPSIAGDLYTGPIETRDERVSIAALTNLVNATYRSSQAAKHALSWRDYAVGSTAIMTNFESGMMGYVNGFNVKPQAGASPLNIHAEQMAISKGRRAGLNRVVAISVFAEPKDEDANPLHRPTLAPCARCVGMFRDIPEVDERTIVLSTNTSLDVCELYTVGSLVDPRTTPLVEGSFSLKHNDDLERYDRTFKIDAIRAIMQMAEI